MRYDTMSARDKAMLGDPPWHELTTVLDTARRRYPDITVGCLNTFIHVATNQRRIFGDKVDLKAIAAEVGCTYAAMTKRARALSTGVQGTMGPALGWLEHHREGRKVLLLLTRKGADIMEELFPDIGPAVRHGTAPDCDVEQRPESPGRI